MKKLIFIFVMFSGVHQTEAQVGVNTETPKSVLDVNGDVKIGTTTDACSSDKLGSVRFNSTIDDFEICRNSSSDASAHGWYSITSKPITITFYGEGVIMQ